MSRRNHTFFKARENDAGSFDVIEEIRSFGSMGPDPGRPVSIITRVKDVSREYATMLSIELTKADFADTTDHHGMPRNNMFGPVGTHGRHIGTITYAGNAANFAEKPALNLVY